jgi:hypothetical protein
LFLIDHYVVIAGGLLWYIKFLTPRNNEHPINLRTFMRFPYELKRIQPMLIILAIIITAGIGVIPIKINMLTHLQLGNFSYPDRIFLF